MLRNPHHAQYIHEYTLLLPQFGQLINYISRSTFLLFWRASGNSSIGAAKKEKLTEPRGDLHFSSTIRVIYCFFSFLMAACCFIQISSLAFQLIARSMNESAVTTGYHLERNLFIQRERESQSGEPMERAGICHVINGPFTFRALSPLVLLLYSNQHYEIKQ